MVASTIGRSYRDWRDAVDRRLHRIYCITIEDAGFDEEYLIATGHRTKRPLNLSNGSETNMTLIQYHRLSYL